MTSEQETSKHYTLDRFEDEWAILEVEAGETFNVPKLWLPEAAAEGDVLKLSLETGSTQSAARFAVDAEETAARRQHARELQERLLKAPEGDFEL